MRTAMALVAGCSLAGLACAQPWVVPASGSSADPRWGHPEGLQVGLWPSGGPRGLIRVFAPYLGNPPGMVINFIAIEPVRGTTRWYSELEPSQLDQAIGKRIWCAKRRVRAGRLAVRFAVEPFVGGQRVAVDVVFRKDRPHEASFAVRRLPGSSGFDACILTATMGNYARLRRLLLRDGPVLAPALWPGYREAGFAPAMEFPLERLPRDERGDVVVAAEPDESDPAAAAYDASVADWWRYRGRPARQSWRVPAALVTPRLRARVNGRATYYGSPAPLPGGVAFENFELEAPFADGPEFVFAVTPAE